MPYPPLPRSLCCSSFAPREPLGLICVFDDDGVFLRSGIRIDLRFTRPQPSALLPRPSLPPARQLSNVRVPPLVLALSVSELTTSGPFIHTCSDLLRHTSRLGPQSSQPVLSLVPSPRAHFAHLAVVAPARKGHLAFEHAGPSPIRKDGEGAVDDRPEAAAAKESRSYCSYYFCRRRRRAWRRSWSRSRMRVRSGSGVFARRRRRRRSGRGRTTYRAGSDGVPFERWRWTHALDDWSRFGKRRSATATDRFGHPRSINRYAPLSLSSPLVLVRSRVASISRPL